MVANTLYKYYSLVGYPGATVYVEPAWCNNVESTMFLAIFSFKLDHGCNNLLVHPR